MKTFLTAMISFVLINAAFAQTETNELPKVKGLIRKVDLVNSKIMVKHERIPNLNMPAMTMSFVVAEPEMLTDLEAGDKILFVAEDLDGETTITWLEEQPQD